MSTRTASFYNRFSFLYPVIDVFLKPQKRVLFNEINNLPDGHLLEVGVGNGAHLPLYRKHEVTAIDTSSEMLRVAANQRCKNVRLLLMNGELLQFDDEQFDYVVLSHVIAVVDNVDQLLKEVFRVLKPGGKLFILNHFTPDNWMKYIDAAFGMISKAFHFRSVFRVHEISALRKFTLMKTVNLGMASYFKLLIYQKK